MKLMVNYNHKKKKTNIIGWPATQLIFRLLMVLILFSLSRWLIYLFNTEFFHHLTLSEAAKLYVIGLRFNFCFFGRQIQSGSIG